MLSPRVSGSGAGKAHVRCQDCIVNYIGTCEDQNKPTKCPVCDKGPIAMSDLRSVQRRRQRLNPLTGKTENGGETDLSIGKVDLVSSTKLRALVRKLELTREQQPDFKALVFSQFTSFLGESCREDLSVLPVESLLADLIEPTLTRAGIKWL